MRTRIAPWLIAAVSVAGVAPGFAAGVAHAQPSSPEPVPLAGFTLRNFDPAPAGDGFFSVPEARVRGLLEPHAMLVGHYADRPLRYTLHNRDYVTHTAHGHLSLSAALAEAILLNADLPFAIVQDGDESTSPGAGIEDLRLSLRVVGHGTPEHVLDLALQLDTWLPTGDEDELRGDGRVRFNPKVVAGGLSDRFVYTTNVGFLFREHRDFGSAEMGNAVTFGVGFGVLALDKRLQLGPELWGNTVLAAEGSESPFLGRNSSPIEAMLGARIRFGDFILGAGLGRGITRAPGVARLRGMLSLTHTFDDRVLDRDGDGWNDPADRCPMDPGFGSNGCPYADSDGDTVPDASDACPAEPGLVHAEAAKHGCPP